MKKFILPIITFLFAIALTTVGALFKIQHWPYGSVLLTIGMLLEVVAILIAIIILIKNYLKKEI